MCICLPQRGGMPGWARNSPSCDTPNLPKNLPTKNLPTKIR